MPTKLQAMVELGPKGKIVVAIGRDWPGLERNGKTEDDALANIERYVERYKPVAERAGLMAEFEACTGVEVIERYTGSGSTDFWGISFVPCDSDREEMTSDELERQLSLLQACWAQFDHVASIVSPELKKGPRGGGRDRDKIVNHTLGTERGWAKGLGVMTPEGAMLTPDGLQQHRADYVAAIREYHAEGKMAGKSPLRFLIRHTAYHIMDHAWEMEDKDLAER